MTRTSGMVPDANPYAAPGSSLSVRLRSSSLSQALWWLQASLVIGLMTTVVSVLFFPAAPDINPRADFLRTLSAFPSIVCLCVSCSLMRKSELKLSRVVKLMGLLAVGKLALHVLWLITPFSQTVTNLTAFLFNPYGTYWFMQLLYPALNVTILLLLVRLASKYGDTRTVLFGRLLLVVYTLSMTLHLIGTASAFFSGNQLYGERVLWIWRLFIWVLWAAKILLVHRVRTLSQSQEEGTLLPVVADSFVIL